jgi:hypothetical protein
VPFIEESEYQEHTLTNPFCGDPSCPCHENRDNIQVLAEQIQDGLLTPQEATDTVNGKII